MTLTDSEKRFIQQLIQLKRECELAEICVENGDMRYPARECDKSEFDFTIGKFGVVNLEKRMIEKLIHP